MESAAPLTRHSAKRYPFSPARPSIGSDENRCNSRLVAEDQSLGLAGGDGSFAPARLGVVEGQERGIPDP